MNAQLFSTLIDARLMLISIVENSIEGQSNMCTEHVRKNVTNLSITILCIESSVIVNITTGMWKFSQSQKPTGSYRWETRLKTMNVSRVVCLRPAAGIDCLYLLWKSIGTRVSTYCTFVPIYSNPLHNWNAFIANKYLWDPYQYWSTFKTINAVGTFSLKSSRTLTVLLKLIISYIWDPFHPTVLICIFPSIRPVI